MKKITKIYLYMCILILLWTRVNPIFLQWLYRNFKYTHDIASSLVSPQAKQWPNCESANSCNPPVAATLKYPQAFLLLLKLSSWTVPGSNMEKNMTYIDSKYLCWNLCFTIVCPLCMPRLIPKIYQIWHNTSLEEGEFMQ